MPTDSMAEATMLLCAKIDSLKAENEQLRAAIRAYVAGLDDQYPGVVMWDLEQALRALVQERNK
jgi:hypothetical protein